MYYKCWYGTYCKKKISFIIIFTAKSFKCMANFLSTRKYFRLIRVVYFFTILFVRMCLCVCVLWKHSFGGNFSSHLLSFIYCWKMESYGKSICNECFLNISLRMYLSSSFCLLFFFSTEKLNTRIVFLKSTQVNLVNLHLFFFLRNGPWWWGCIPRGSGISISGLYNLLGSIPGGKRPSGESNPNTVIIKKKE